MHDAQVSASAQTNEPDNKRRSANFHPSIWGDYFLSYASGEENNEKLMEHDKLKEEIKKMLIIVDWPVNEISIIELIQLIDAIKHLGVSYHFEKEIDNILKQIYIHDHLNFNDDLYTLSLRFRLLRQQGYKASCEVFHKFKDTQGKFKEFLIKDVRGLIGLYEASHLRLHGEDILEEALVFTITHLESYSKATELLNPTLVAQLTHALMQPIQKSLQRLEARRYIPIYEEDPSRNEALLTFAKLDFNMLQKLHQKELCDISRWWKSLDVAKNFPFARDRLVECYFWTLGVYFEPEYFLGRKILTKVISITSIMDDIFDGYGTMKELEHLTNAIERWEISATEQLPEYMKSFYIALLDVYKEIEEIMESKGTLYRLPYAKEKMKCQAKAYFQEAKWYHFGHVPKVEEYNAVALISTGYSLLITTSFLGMGDIVTKYAFDWLRNHPKIVSASEIITRFMDDIVSRKFEQERGHVASYIECYMKQYGVEEEKAIKELRIHIINAWKDINNECLYPIPVPMPLLVRVLNFTRVIDVLYKDGDGYTHSGTTTKRFIISVLIETVPM